MTNVLLVEDDVLLARQFSKTLELADMTVRCAYHAGEAMVMIDEQLPDVLSLDMLLPVTSGLALLHELQSYDDTMRIPVVVCTSMASTLTLEELAPYGVVRLVDKTTMDPRDLVTAVRAMA
jgi:two-component system phosphate regulon response regulator PhoB